MNAVAATGSAVLISLGVWLLYASRDLIKSGLASYKWHKTEGTIIDSQNDSFTLPGINPNQGVSAVSYKQSVHYYTYEVEGRMYKSNTYCFGGWAETAGAAYLIGTQIPVYYDPEQPERAVLWPGVKLGAIFGILPICAGLIWLFFAIGD